MHVILLLILSIPSITISALPQAEDDGQFLSNNDVNSLNPKPIQVDDTNSLLAYDPYASGIDSSNPTDDPASQNLPIITDETANENDQPTNLASDDVAGQKSPACESDLATRDELDNSIFGCSPFSILDKL